MDALSSISPYSLNPDTRRHHAPDAEPFSLAIADHHRHDGEHRPAPPTPPAPHSIQGLSPLGKACSLLCGPATSHAISDLAELVEQSPDLALASRIERGSRGEPLQAFPALALAAIQGVDPEGWIEPLIAIGANLDAKSARAEACSDLMSSGLHRGSKLSALIARCESLSIWTLACAEAHYPHSALRAIDKARRLSPAGLAPLRSELSRFGDPREHDKPGIESKARAGAFIEAAREDPRLCAATLPEWIIGPRGNDAALLADSACAALGMMESIELARALLPHAANPNALAFLHAIETQQGLRENARWNQVLNTSKSLL